MAWYSPPYLFFAINLGEKAILCRLMRLTPAKKQMGYIFMQVNVDKRLGEIEGVATVEVAMGYSETGILIMP